VTGRTSKTALFALAAVGVASWTLPARAQGQEPTGSAKPPSATPAPAAAAPQGPPPPGDPLGPDLFVAVGSGRTADIKAAIAKGAKVEGRNWLEITPLIWAAMIGNEPACAALLDAGADVNTSSRFGNPLAFAEMSGNASLVRLLLDRGAKMADDRADGITPLMTAAESGRADALRLLLKHAPAGAVNAADADGTTPLMYAARRGQTETARTLLQAGAKVDARDIHGRTALMYAAQGGHAADAALLIRNKAEVNAKDKSGDTALLLAARYHGDQKVFAALLLGGADRGLKDGKGRTAYDLAITKENPAAPALLPAARLSRTSAAADAADAGSDAASLPAQSRRAVERSLPLIERSTKTFSERATCTSCHHQGIGLMATGVARERGFRIDGGIAAGQIKLILETDKAFGGGLKDVLPHPEMYKNVPGVDIGELTPILSFLYSGLLEHGERGGEIESNMAVVLASQQSEDGKFGFLLMREPMQSSIFATTALSVRVLDSFLPADRAAEKARRIAAARDWLTKSRPVTNEDRTFRLLGLKWAGADAATIAGAAADLRAAQRPDGGWAQMSAADAAKPGMGEAYARSDAYATGQALYALNVGGGVATTSEEYRKGVRFLLRTQDEDGSWLVTKRAAPVNTYFDAGFPHGHSQYVSYAATCWATMALAVASEPAPAGKGKTLARN